ncbi:MAG: methyltransferase family protein [bacterium]
MKSSVENGEHPFGDTGQLILLYLFLLILMGDSFFFRKSTFLSDYVPWYIRMIILGLSLVTAFFLAKSGHTATSHAAGILSSGAFRYVRHPLYLGSILFYFGMAVSTASLLSLALLAVICVFYNYIAGYEEKMLQERFGEEYINYKKRTGKWVPKISLQ